MFAAEVRLLDSSLGPAAWRSRWRTALDDFDRVAVERAALAVAIDLLAQQHDEQLRARSRGAFLSELADGRVEEHDARRRAEALGFPARAAGALLPVVAAWRRPPSARGRHAARAGDGERRRRRHLDAALRRPARRAVLDRLRRPARPARRRPARAAGAGRARLRRGAGRARRAPLPRRAGPARARPRGRGAWRSAASPTRGSRRARGCGACAARRARPRRSPVARWYDARRPGVADLLHDLRDTPELETFVEEQLGPLLADGSPRTRVLLETLEAYLAAGGRKAEAARALHLERQSLYLRLQRIEEALGVSLDDEDVVLGPAPGRPRAALPPRD